MLAKILLTFIFLINAIGPLPLDANAQGLSNLNHLILPTSIQQQPILVKGLTLIPDKPLNFDFIVEPSIAGGDIRHETLKMAKYFMACLTIPEKDMWVNLSPYEKDRIVPDQLSQTLLGRDMLAQDYVLKQMASSLMHPDTAWGHDFWKKVYQQTAFHKGKTNIGVKTFNKVWIVPDKASVWEQGQSVFIVERHLKVMTESDYLAMTKVNSLTPNQSQQRIMQEVIIPVLEKEVNEGAHFAQLRQIYNMMILATWYKKKIKDSLLAKVYVNKNKVNKEQPHQHIDNIYQHYLKSVSQGVFNFIKEEEGSTFKPITIRKYFAGGLGAVHSVNSLKGPLPASLKPQLPTSQAMIVSFKLRTLAKKTDSAMVRRSFVINHKLFQGDITVQFSERKPYRVNISYQGKNIKPLYVRSGVVIFEIAGKIIRIEQVDLNDFDRMAFMFDSLSEQGKAPKLFGYGKLSDEYKYFIVEKIIGNTVSEINPKSDELIEEIVDLIEFLVEKNLIFDFHEGNMMKKSVGPLILHDLEHMKLYTQKVQDATIDGWLDIYDFSKRNYRKNRSKYFPLGLTLLQDYILQVFESSFKNQNDKNRILSVLKQRHPEDFKYLGPFIDYVKANSSQAMLSDQAAAQTLDEKPTLNRVSPAMAVSNTSKMPSKAMKTIEEEFQELSQLSGKSILDEPGFPVGNEIKHAQVVAQIQREAEQVGVRTLFVGVSGLQTLDFMLARHDEWGIIIDINKRVGELYGFVKDLFVSNPNITRAEFTQWLKEKLSSNSKNEVNVFSYFAEKEARLSYLQWLDDDIKFESVKKNFLDNKIVFIQGNITDTTLLDKIKKWIQKAKVKLDVLYISNIHQWPHTPARYDYLKYIVDSNSVLILDSNNPVDALNLRVKRLAEYSDFSLYVEEALQTLINAASESFSVIGNGGITFGEVYGVDDANSLLRDFVIKIPKPNVKEESFDFAKNNLDGIMPPFNIVHDVTINGKHHPFVVVQKRLKVFNVTSFSSELLKNYTLPNGGKVDFVVLKKSLIENLVKRGIYYQDVIVFRNMGLDEDTGKLYLIDFGDAVFVSRNDDRFLIDIFAPPSTSNNSLREDKFQRVFYNDGMDGVHYDDIGVATTEELFNLWATESSQNKPIADISFKANLNLAMNADAPTVDAQGHYKVRESAKTGGIDFTNDQVLKVNSMKNVGDGVNFDPAMVQSLSEARVFVPVIVGITPLKDFQAYLQSKQ